jgi:hypothetical protein
MGGKAKEPRRREDDGAGGYSSRPHPAIPCRVAPQQSPTPFHRVTISLPSSGAFSQQHVVASIFRPFGGKILAARGQSEVPLGLGVFSRASV